MTHKEQPLGVSVGMETVTLIYNKKLLERSAAEKYLRPGRVEYENQTGTPWGFLYPLGLQKRLLFLGNLSQRRGLHLC